MKRYLKLLLLISILPLGYLVACYPIREANTLEQHLDYFRENGNMPRTVWMPPGECWLFFGDDRYSGFFLAYKWMGNDWEVSGFIPFKRKTTIDPKEFYLEAIGESPWEE